MSDYDFSSFGKNVSNNQINSVFSPTSFDLKSAMDYGNNANYSASSNFGAPEIGSAEWFDGYKADSTIGAGANGTTDIIGLGDTGGDTGPSFLEEYGDDALAIGKFGLGAYNAYLNQGMLANAEKGLNSQIAFNTTDLFNRGTDAQNSLDTLRQVRANTIDGWVDQTQNFQTGINGQYGSPEGAPTGYMNYNTPSGAPQSQPQYNGGILAPTEAQRGRTQFGGQGGTDVFGLDQYGQQQAPQQQQVAQQQVPQQQMQQQAQQNRQAVPQQQQQQRFSDQFRGR